MLRSDGLRDDDTKVDVFLKGNDAAVVRAYEESTHQAVDFLKTDTPIHRKRYQIGEKTSLSVYGGNDTTLLSVLAEYKVSGWGSGDDVKKAHLHLLKFALRLSYKKISNTYS